VTAYGYVRVSTQAQADSGLGLEAQKAELIAYAAQRGMLMHGVYADLGISGSKPFKRRPEGKALSETLENGDAVLLRLDRGFRSSIDCILTVDGWLKDGVDVHLIDLGVDTSTAAGALVYGIMARFAEFERRLIRERTQRAMAAREDRGLPPNGQAPAGYRIGDDKRLEIDQEKAMLVGELWHLRRHRKSWAEVAKHAQKIGFTRKSGKPHDRVSIYACLARHSRKHPERRAELEQYWLTNRVSDDWGEEDHVEDTEDWDD